MVASLDDLGKYIEDMINTTDQLRKINVDPTYVSYIEGKRIAAIEINAMFKKVRRHQMMHDAVAGDAPSVGKHMK